MEVLENVPEYEEEDYPHDHLYDRNLTLVNLTNFKFLINSDICNVRRVSLVTIIHSASQNTEARAIIRWGLRNLFIVCKADLYILMLCLRASVTPSLTACSK